MEAPLLIDKRTLLPSTRQTHKGPFLKVRGHTPCAI